MAVLAPPLVTEAVLKPTLPAVLPELRWSLCQTFEAGSLRFGGDAPDGLILVGVATAARNVDLFDTETNAFLKRTVSASDGTYAFTGLIARPQGYFVIGRGILANGESDFIKSHVHPGTP